MWTERKIVNYGNKVEHGRNVKKKNKQKTITSNSYIPSSECFESLNNILMYENKIFRPTLIIWILSNDETYFGIESHNPKTFSSYNSPDLNVASYLFRNDRSVVKIRHKIKISRISHVTTVKRLSNFELEVHVQKSEIVRKRNCVFRKNGKKIEN